MNKILNNHIIAVTKSLRTLTSSSTDKADYIFVMKSPYTPQGWKYDHIGFRLQNGSLKDMSGHRYDQSGEHPMPPVIYRYVDTEKLFQMPHSIQEAVSKGLYAEKKLPQTVVVPDTVTCHSQKAVNCSSFVKIILQNAGIQTSNSDRPDEIFAAL